MHQDDIALKRMEKNLHTGSQNWTMERGKSENNQDSLFKQVPWLSSSANTPRSAVEGTVTIQPNS